MKATFYSKDFDEEFDVETIWPKRDQFSIYVGSDATIIDGVDQLKFHSNVRAKSDDDLRDEVAMAVLPALLTEYAVDKAVCISFEMEDIWMAERARRREGR